MGKGRIWIWLGVGLFVLAMLLAAGLPTVNLVLGERAWNAAQEQLRAGEHPMEIAEILPPPLPPGSDYFVDHPWIASHGEWETDGDEATYDDPLNQSVLGRLLDEGQVASLKLKLGRPAPEPFRTDFRAMAEKLQLEGTDPLAALLAWKKKDDPLFSELAVAATRPAGYFPPSVDVENPWGHQLPWGRTWIATTRTIVARSRIHLAEGRSEIAAREYAIIFRLLEILDKEPSMLAHMVSQTLLLITVNGVWEGLERGAWTEADLIALEREYSSRNSQRQFLAALEFERLAFYQMVDSLPEQFNSEGERKANPFGVPGVIPHLKAEFTGRSLRLTAMMKNRDWEGIRTLEKEIDQPYSKWNLNRSMANIAWPVVKGLGPMSVRADATVAMVRTAMALERHYLMHGSFPESLSKLDPSLRSSPSFLSDPCHPKYEFLRYQRTPNGRYQIYSIGWNLVDDGGSTLTKVDKPDSIDSEKGDIVWKFTAETTLPKRP